ncbi:MAG: cache domain-containing protein, partial [Methanoregula sp.]
MKLQSRVLLLYLLIAVLVLVLIGGVLPTTLQQQNLDTISRDSINQLRHIDFALSNFIGEAKYDVLALSLNDNIQRRDDASFTNFLNASGGNFNPSVGDKEQAIINILRDYQTSHPYVSSVYMGRENGAFVRSYPRLPTAYDPRERPWYILAKEHPGQVTVTDPYRAVTTPDVNIGIVTPLLDRNGTMIGVVGADITLVNLTSYISTVGSINGGEMILTDQKGTILATGDSSRLFGNISDILGDRTPVFLATKEGVLVLNGTYLMYYTSPELGWKIGTFVPFSTIEQR